MHRFADTKAYTHAQTFAALRSVVGIPSWAILAFHGSLRVDAFAFAVTAPVVSLAPVRLRN